MLPVDVGFDTSAALSGNDGRLVIELVAGISSTKEVLVRYGLVDGDATEQQVKAALTSKLRNAQFRAAYKEARQKWNSDLNVQERIRFKAALLAEDGLQDLFMILKNDMAPAAARLDAHKHLTDLAQVKPSKGDAPSERFSVVINLGDPSKKVEIDARPIRQIEHT